MMIHATCKTKWSWDNRLAEAAIRMVHEKWDKLRNKEKCVWTKTSAEEKSHIRKIRRNKAKQRRVQMNNLSRWSTPWRLLSYTYTTARPSRTPSCARCTQTHIDFLLTSSSVDFRNNLAFIFCSFICFIMCARDGKNEKRLHWMSLMMTHKHPVLVKNEVKWETSLKPRISLCSEFHVPVNYILTCHIFFISDFFQFKLHLWSKSIHRLNWNRTGNVASIPANTNN